MRVEKIVMVFLLCWLVHHPFLPLRAAELEPLARENGKSGSLSHHPILHCSQVSELSAVLKESSVYRQLLEARYDANKYKYRNLETVAANMFVSQLVGISLFDFQRRYSQLNFFTESRTLKRAIVHVGFCAIPVCLSFDNGQCVEATIVTASNCKELDPGMVFTAHPILGSQPFEGLNCGNLATKLFRQLNQMSFPYEGLRNRGLITWRDCFLNSESDAARSFVELARNGNSERLLQLAGEPSIKTGPITCWDNSQKDDFNWIYFFGSSQVPVRVLFRNSRIVSVDVLSDDARESFKNWKLHQFIGTQSSKKTLVGKKIGELLRLDPNPSNKIEGEIGYILVYNYDKGGRISLTIENGICVDAHVFVLM